MLEKKYRSTNPSIPEKTSSMGRSKNKLTGEDFMFLLGLGLFITFLIIAHPYTTNLMHQNLVFWMSVTLLFLSMVPDYLNKKRTEKWLKKYKNTKLEGLYKRIYMIADNSERYFSSDKFFIAGIVLTILAIMALFHTGEISELIFGVSYGFFMRSILV